MKYFKPLSISFLLIISSINLIAQKTSSSYVVRIGGDTLFGNFHKIRSGIKENPRKFDFLSDSADEKMTLKPRDCKYIFIDAAHIYLPYVGKRMTNPATSKGAFIFNDAETPDRYKNVAVFLRKITSTKYCDFYILTDTKRINLFYGVKGKPVQELISQVYASGGRLIEADSFRQQLNNIFSDITGKNNLAGLIRTMEYSEEGMIQLANTVNATK